MEPNRKLAKEIIGMFEEVLRNEEEGSLYERIYHELEDRITKTLKERVIMTIEREEGNTTNKPEHGLRESDIRMKYGIHGSRPLSYPPKVGKGREE